MLSTLNEQHVDRGCWQRLTAWLAVIVSVSACSSDVQAANADKKECPKCQVHLHAGHVKDETNVAVAVWLAPAIHMEVLSSLSAAAGCCRCVVLCVRV